LVESTGYSALIFYLDDFKQLRLIFSAVAGAGRARLPRMKEGWNWQLSLFGVGCLTDNDASPDEHVAVKVDVYERN